jgi:hypothetical protein
MRSQESPHIVAQLERIAGVVETLEVRELGAGANEEVEAVGIAAPTKVNLKRTVRVVFADETAHEEASLFGDEGSAPIEGLLRNREHGAQHFALEFGGLCLQPTRIVG